MAAGAPARRLEWAAGALDAFLSTVARIAADDPFTARQFVERVQQALAAIVASNYPITGKNLGPRLKHSGATFFLGATFRAPAAA